MGATSHAYVFCILVFESFVHLLARLFKTWFRILLHNRVPISVKEGRGEGTFGGAAYTISDKRSTLPKLYASR